MNARLTATARMTRLLGVIPWVNRQDGVTLDEIASRFDYPKADLVSDLTEVVQLVGVPPYTPDTLIEVAVEDERVWIRYADYFNRPMRLSPEEAVALMTAGRAMLDVVGDDDSGPLLSALTKLGNALGNPNVVEIRLGDASEETMAVLRRAIAERRQVAIDYYSYGRDLRSERTIDPARLFSDEGQWYVAAYCHLAHAERVFRVDRIGRTTLLDETFEPSSDTRGLQLLDPRAALPRVTLEVGPDSQWVLEQYPHDHVEQCNDGWTRVTLPVTARAWLERLLVRLGSSGRVIDAPPGWGIDLRTAAARRILDRYGFEGELALRLPHARRPM